MGKQCYDGKDIDQIVKRLRGLSEIVDVIREYKIPLVGHNFGLDLLYFFQMFCTDLPGMFLFLFLMYIYTFNKNLIYRGL